MRRIILGLVLLGCATARPSAVDVVERELAAYNAQDADAFAATYAEDATVTRGGRSSTTRSSQAMGQNAPTLGTRAGCAISWRMA